MARLPRVTSKVFAENATEVGQFGSLNAGTKVTTTDIATIQGLPAWKDGWQAATLGDNCYPTLQERNGLDKVQSYMTNYLYQEGIPEWDAGTTYYIGSIVKLINGTDVQFYKSLIDNNTNALSDTASWQELDYANNDLSNLSDAGEKHFLNYNQITNCIIEVPNNINIEVENGILTLKAGSVVTYPDGFEDDNTTRKFKKVTIENDITYTMSGTDLGFVFLEDDNLTITSAKISQSVAGSTAPTTGAWYDSDNNIVKYYSSGSMTLTGMSFPIAIIDRTNNTLNQVFNHCGWIGSSCFVLEGVKCLSPDGRNADGSLKNKVITTINSIDKAFSANTIAYMRIHSDSSVDATTIFRTTTVDSYGNLPVISDNSLHFTFVKEDNQWYRYYAPYNEFWVPYDFGCVGFLITDADKKPTIEFSIRQPISIMDMENPMIPNIDGQWTNVNAQIADSVTYPTTTNLTYSLSSILPNDNNNYEILLVGIVRTGSISGNDVTLAVQSDILNGHYSVCICGAQTRSNSTVYSYGTTILPISTSRNLYINPSTSYEGTFTLRIVGYRRIGTNN